MKIYLIDRFYNLKKSFAKSRIELYVIGDQYI